MYVLTKSMVEYEVIVGAGITGLYTAYKLIKSTKRNPNILVIERNNRIGGRVYTYKHESGLSYDVGAGRIGKKHKYVMKLIKELKLEDKLYRIKDDKYWFVDGKLLKNERELLRHYNSSFTSLSKCWKYAISAKSVLNPMNVNLRTYLDSVLDTNEVKMLESSLGYISEMYDMNAANALHTLRKDFDVENNDFYIMIGGLQQICDCMYDILVISGVKFMFNCGLVDIDSHKRELQLSNSKNVKYTNLYMTITRKDYVDIPYFVKYRSILDTPIIDGKLLRIYAKYPVKSVKSVKSVKEDNHAWFNGIPKTITDNKLLFIIPIDSKSGLIQISYSDNHVTTFWNNLPDEKTVRKFLRKYLREVFYDTDGIDIPEPEWITFHNWDNGVHYWRIGENSKKIQNRMKKEFGKDNIYVLGETYSDSQAWIEGGLETVHKISIK
jgi:hypothetical protein